MQRFCPDGNFLFRAIAFHFPWLLQSWPIVRTTSDKQISRAFQGFFRDKLRFLRSKIYLINRHSLTPLITLLTKTRPRLCKMTAYDLQLHLRYRNRIWNCIWGTEIEFEKKKKQKLNIVYAQKCSCITHEFYTFFHRGWAKFSSAK